jgi:hypothetical protein
MWDLSSRDGGIPMRRRQPWQSILAPGAFSSSSAVSKQGGTSSFAPASRSSDWTANPVPDALRPCVSRTLRHPRRRRVGRQAHDDAARLDLDRARQRRGGREPSRPAPPERRSRPTVGRGSWQARRCLRPGRRPAAASRFRPVARRCGSVGRRPRMRAAAFSAPSAGGRKEPNRNADPSGARGSGPGRARSGRSGDRGVTQGSGSDTARRP